MNHPTWFAKLDMPAECVSRQSSAKEKQSSLVIHLAKDDQIWRVKVDGCWLKDEAAARCDYLFYGQSHTGWQMTLLVELKGKHLGKALQQIEATILRLRNAYQGDLRACIILSRGKGVPQRLKERELLRRKYGLRLRIHTTRLEVQSIEAFR